MQVYTEGRKLQPKGVKPMKILPLLIANVLLCTAISAQDQDQTDSDIEEIIIIGELSRTALKAQIVAVENDFYRLFNANNNSDELDISCRIETPTGTHFPQRVCEPAFLVKARQRNINDWLVGIDVHFTPTLLQASLSAEFVELNATYGKLLLENESVAEVIRILTALRNRLAVITGR